MYNNDDYHVSSKMIGSHKSRIKYFLGLDPFSLYSVLISDNGWNFVIRRTACATWRLEGMSLWFF